MSELALKLIEENKAAHARGDKSAEVLCLGNCGLTDLPKQLFDLNWLIELRLGPEFRDYKTQSFLISENKGRQNQITNIPEGIIKLENLRTLDLSYNWISDFSMLEELTGLQTLHLMSNRIIDIRFLEKLTSLQTLNLFDNRIRDIRFLEKLTGLQTLDLSSNQISDISILENLTGLQMLHLDFNQISDFSILEKLTSLQRLSLSKNQISNIRFLEKLTRLQTLDLSSNQISDISILENLTGLQSLGLSENRISDISILENLTGLQELYLRFNKISEFPRFLLSMSKLVELHLHRNPIWDVPSEIINISSPYKLNCLKRARDYFAALKKGSIPNNEAKLILLGNGRVGKTSLITAMLDKKFYKDVESTDKILLRSWPLDDVKPGILKGEPLRINIWDFGGQDIYYATHRIFLRTRALFLLVWDRQTEEATTHNDNYGDSFENFKLLHWIDYIRTASDSSPVIVVQNKVDKRDDKYTGYEKLLRENYEPIFDFQYVSAKIMHKEGIPILLDCIREAYENKVPAIGQLIGKQWMAVKKRLRQLQDKRSIEYGEYLDICREEGLEGTEHETLINLLHDSGFLYYLKQANSHKVIIDQRWAIDAVYAVLNRKDDCYNELCHINRHGFTLSDLGRFVWDKNYSPEEQKELLKFMVDAKVCFEFTKGIYVAPQLLDPKPPSKIERRKEWMEPKGPAIKFCYKFLHSAIIEGFIVKAGRMVKDDDPIIWRNGIAIYDDTCNTDALIEADATKKEIRIFTHGDQPLVLIKKIIEELNELHRDYEPEILFSTNGGAHFVSKKDIEDYHRAEASKVKDETGEFVELLGFLPFLQMFKTEYYDDEQKKGLPETKLKDYRMVPEKPVLKCFISYAHAYDDYYKVFLDDFETATTNLSFTQLKIWSDEKIPLGEDWHESIQAEVATCDFAILLISDKFMASKYIKQEEVAKLFKRKKTDGILVLPVYFYTCRFTDWPELGKNQLFKPKGADYGYGEKDKRNWFCYADLVEIEMKDGVTMIKPNPNRSRYMMDFINKIEDMLKEIVERKYGYH